MHHILSVPSVSLFLFSFGCSLTLPVRVTLPVGYRCLSRRYPTSFHRLGCFFRPPCSDLQLRPCVIPYTPSPFRREKQGIGPLCKSTAKTRGPAAHYIVLCQIGRALLLLLGPLPPSLHAICRLAKPPCRPLLVEDMQLGHTTNRRRLCGTVLFHYE
ncbi:hypothetical protein HDV63DRAFT_338115 [Trichoderma sp. SZMC 28014]